MRAWPGVLLVPLLLLTSPPPAAAGTASQAVEGWWQTSVAGLPGSTNPLVPAGGLDVSQGPLGPTAVSALRVPAAAGDRLLVTLTLARGATSPTVALQACPTTSTWVPVAGGDLANAPSLDCKDSVIGQVSAGTVSWAFGPGFVRHGFVDVGIVPADGAEPFAAPFAPPGPTALKLSSEQPPDASSSPPAASAQAPVLPGPPVPATYVAVSPALPPPLTVTRPQVVAAAPPAVAVAHSSVRTALRRAEGPLPRGVAWSLLAALLLAAAATALRGRAVVSDEPPVRGVGRFARQHLEPAPRL